MGALADARDDEGHQVDEGGEEDFAGVLALGTAVEQRIEGSGRQGVLHGAAGHHADRAVFTEALEDRPQQHGAPPGRMPYPGHWKKLTAPTAHVGSPGPIGRIGPRGPAGAARLADLPNFAPKSVQELPSRVAHLP